MRVFLCALAFGTALLLPTFSSSSERTAAPVHAVEVRLVRYSYAVTWSGAAQGLLREGKAAFLLQADLETNQQTLHLVRTDGYQLVKVVQQGTTAFVAPTGKDTVATFDLALGTRALGVPVGLASFVDWAQGRDATGPVEQARVVRDRQGRAIELEENDWTISYDEWTSAQGVALAVPKRWRMRHSSGLEMQLALIQAQAFSETTLPVDYRPILIR